MIHEYEIPPKCTRLSKILMFKNMKIFSFFLETNNEHHYFILKQQKKKDIIYLLKKFSR
jgi:hypothetical protein